MQHADDSQHSFLQALDQHSTTRCPLWRGCTPSGKSPHRRNTMRDSGRHSLLVWLKLMSIITILVLQMHISLPWVSHDPLSLLRSLTFHCSAQSSLQNESLQKAVGSQSFFKKWKTLSMNMYVSLFLFTQFQTLTWYIVYPVV